MMKQLKQTISLSTCLLIVVSLFAQRKKQLLYHDRFNDLGDWIVEQREGGKASIIKERFEIEDVGGCTAWFKEKLEAPFVITYKAKVIDQGGPNDRVSDLNCFWLAKDMEYPSDFFHSSAKRGGKFGNYHSLRLYYVGLGGHNNSKTRFRRYIGTGERPLLPEHDLSDKKYLIKANKINRIKIVVDGQSIKYFYNGMLVFDVIDPEPYKEGYFGIRTVNNHMWVDDFKVYRLDEGKAR